MDDMQRLLIERECARLMVDYTHFIDLGEAERVAELFTKVGVLLGISETALHGQDQIRAFFRARQENTGRVSSHVCTNLKIDVIDEHTAEGVVYLTLYRHDGDPDDLPRPLDGPVVVGHYRDTFARTDEGWRFASRRLEVSFRSRGSP
jgi:hypothetical protein